MIGPERKPQDIMADESMSDKEKVTSLSYMILRYHGAPEADEAVRLIEQIQSRVLKKCGKNIRALFRQEIT